MFIEVLIISLLFVKINGGSVKELEKIHIKGWKLILIGFIIQILSFFFIVLINGELENWYGRIHLITYLLVTIVLLYNIEYKGFKLMAMGNIMNGIAMIFNNGKMPVYIGALNMPGLERQKALLKSGELLTHSLVDRSFPMFFFADIISIPKPYIVPKVISIGDISLALGIIIFIIRYSRKNN